MTSEMNPLAGHIPLTGDGVSGEPMPPLAMSNRHLVPETTHQAQSVDFFRAMVNSIPQLVWRARADGVIDYLSEQWYEFTGVRRYQFEGADHLDKDWRSVIHEDDAPAFVASWKSCVERGRRFEAECRIHRVGQGHAWHLCRAAPVRDGLRNVVSWYGTCTYLEDQRKERDDLRAAGNAKDRFLATLSHELRTPLNPALLLIADLESDNSLPPRSLERLRTVRRNIEHEARLVGDLVDLSAGLHGKLVLRCAAIDMHDVVKQALDVCKPELDAKRITVTQAWDAPDCLLVGDPDRLRQVIWNLLRNATKFTPTGGMVEIGSAKHSGNLLRVWVKDNGIGIDPDTLPRLFVPFEQADKTTARRYGGLGLGLAIARNIAELHQGNLFAVSDGAGQGATFVLELPLLVSAKVPERRPAGTSSVETVVMRQLRILLVDDHIDSATALGNLLRKIGHIVECAHSAAVGLETARENSFDLIISDVLLPDLVGWDFIRTIRQFSKVPAIAISGLGSEDDIVRCLNAGFDDYLVKPISGTALRNSISAVAG